MIWDGNFYSVLYMLKRVSLDQILQPHLVLPLTSLGFESGILGSGEYSAPSLQNPQITKQSI